jgi:hypothetical protein
MIFVIFQLSILPLMNSERLLSLIVYNISTVLSTIEFRGVHLHVSYRTYRKTLLVVSAYESTRRYSCRSCKNGENKDSPWRNCQRIKPP